MFRKLIGALVGLAFFGMAGTSNATIIDFDPTPSPSGSGPETGGEFYVDGDYRIEFFWRAFTFGSFISGHDHIANTGIIGIGNVEGQHFNGCCDLQGFLITRVDGMAFDLQFLDYRISDLSSISGFSNSDVNVLISTGFDPNNTAVSEFTAFSIGNTIPSFFSTLAVTGFNGVTSAWFSSSASVLFDNISVVAAIPEPSTLAIFAFGLFGLGFVTRWRRTGVGKSRHAA